MKKQLVLIFACSALFSVYATQENCHRNERYSRTFLTTRPINGHLAMRQALWHNFLYTEDEKTHSGMQMTAAYQESCDPDRVARYFLFDGKNTLFVSGDANDATNPLNSKQRDVRAEWLNLPSNFQGELSVAPRQKQFMFAVSGKKDVKAIFDNEMFENTWVGFDAPIIFVENNMHLTQSNVYNPGTDPLQPRDIIDSFRQPSWHYLRVNGERTKITLGDLRLLLGRTYLAQDNFTVGYYSIINLPSAGQQNGKYMFDPVVGHNGHFGYGVGVNFQLVMNRDISAFEACFFADLQATFFARRNELRTFDLCNKPWSRYLLFVRDDQGINQTPIPGVNVLTREVRVRPYGFFNMSGGVRFKIRRLEAEIGYSIWGHADERIELRCRPCPFNVGIAGDPSMSHEQEGNCPAQAVTASESTISCRAPNDPVFVPIEDKHLDLRSAEAQSTLNNKVHVAFGIVEKSSKVDGFIGAGFFYDAPNGNRALHLVGAWAKFGALF